MSYGTCVILSGLAVRHPRRSVCLSPVSAVVREETSPAPRTRRCSGIAWYSDFVFPIVFVLAALMVVAAGSLGLLVRTLKYVQKKLRRRAPHSPCPWLGPFFVDRARCWRFLSRGHFNLAKGVGVDSEGRSGGEARKRKKKEKK